MPQQITLPKPSEVSEAAFIEEAQPLVKNAVTGWMGRHPVSQGIDREVFESSANLAVLEASRDYDPERNDEIIPYLIMKMGWAMLNELNSIIGASSGAGIKGSTWSKSSEVRRWIKARYEREGRMPGLADCKAAFPGKSDAILLNLLHYMDVEQQPLPPPSEIASDESTAGIVEGKAMFEWADGWLRRNLSMRDYTIFERAVLHEHRREDIGQSLGLTKQRINQIVGLALSRIRDELGVAIA